MAERQGGGTGGRRSGSGSQSRSGGRGGQRRGGGSDRRRSGGRSRYGRRRKRCSFCAEKVTHIDYKTPDVLRYFLTEQGKIRPRRQTGVCARHQRRLAMAIKRARHLAMLPFIADVNRRR